MSIEQAVKDLIEEYVDEIDWDDKIDLVFVENALRHHVNLADTNASEIEEVISSWMDEHERSGIDADKLAERLRSLLESVPASRGSRCSLGDAFTSAVEKVLMDDEVQDRLRRIVEGIVDERAVVASVAANEPEATEGTGSDAGSTVSTEPVTKFGVRLGNEQNRWGQNIVVGPFESESEAVDWAQRTNRHGNIVTVEIPA